MNYSIQVVTPPASEPVTLAELKAHLRLSGTAEDAQLTTYLQSAREQFEMSTDRAVKPTTFDMGIAEWPSSGTITLPRSPATTLTSTKYYDTANTEQTLSGVSSDMTGLCGLVILPGTLPAISTTKARPITIRFVAGWTTVPETVRLAIMLLSGHFFRVREAYQDSAFLAREMPMGFQRVVDQYKIYPGGV